MGFTKKSNNTFAAFLNAVIMSGGHSQTGGSGNIVPSAVTGTTVEEGGDLVFTVSFGASSSLRLVTVSFSGSAVNNIDFVPLNYAAPVVHNVSTGYAFGTIVTYSNQLYVAVSPYNYLVYPGTDVTIWKPLTTALSNGVQVFGNALVVPAGISSFTITIPTLFNYHLDSGLTLNLIVGGITGVGTITQKAEVWTQITQATGRTINLYHFGTHLSADPTGLHNPTVAVDIDTINFGMARTHNTPCGNWWHHEQTQGTYVWSGISWASRTYSPDAIITYFGNRNIPVMYTFRCPPSYAVRAPEGAPVWAATTAFTRVAPGSINFYNGIYPTNNSGAMYHCVQSGTSGGTIPDFTIQRSNIASIGSSWASTSGGTLTLTLGSTDVSKITNGDLITLENSAAGEYVVTVVDSTHISVPLAVNPGTLNPLPAVNLVVRDGTVQWRSKIFARDPNYVPGGGYAWKNSASTNYLNAFLNRYCKTSAVNPSNKIMVKWIEVSNEPFAFYYDPQAMTYLDTPKSLVDMVYETKQIVLAWETANGITANTIKVIPAGFTYDVSTSNCLGEITSYISAVGNTNPTVHGYQTCSDGISWHRYSTSIWSPDNFLTGIGNTGQKLGIASIQALLVANGMSSTIPQIISEWGLLNHDNPGQLPAFANYQALSTIDRKKVFLAQAVVSALQGLDAICYYGTDYGAVDSTGAVTADPALKDLNYYGPCGFNRTELRDAMNEFATNYAGKTVTTAYMSNLQRVKATIGGVDYIIDTPKGYFY